MNLVVKVAGVTYEGRQNVIARLNGNEPCRLVPEPENKYDKNAIAVQVATNGHVAHIGYVPRDLASLIAPHLEGESLMVNIKAIIGGFEKWDGSLANRGVLLDVELPEEQVLLS